MSLADRGSRVDIVGRVRYNRRITGSSFLRRLLLSAVAFLLLDTVQPASARTQEVDTAGRISRALLLDLDGDGLADTAIAAARGLDVDMTRGNSVTLDGTGDLAAVAADDIDGDGDRDVVALTARGTVLHVWRNDGRGRFEEERRDPPATRTPVLAIGSTLGDRTGSGSGDAAPTTPRSFEAHSLETRRVHLEERHRHFASLGAGLHLTAPRRTGPPRSPPLA